VGKGILFDTGGTNLKAAKDMLDMHMDMSGSAVALALLQALTQLRLPVAVDCWLAITENRTGPAAYKQRDVVTACNGTTIEVIHTDAEGRMVLADTLALAGKENPHLILDFATLTGACVYALSERYSGALTNREALHGPLVTAGRGSGERVWPFPMDADFDDDLKSSVADVAQCALANEADQILAARFLQRFVPEKSAWVHVDLAAAHRKDGLAHLPGGPTGFGVRFALNLLLDESAALQAVTGDLGLGHRCGDRRVQCKDRRPAGNRRGAGESRRRRLPAAGRHVFLPRAAVPRCQHRAGSPGGEWHRPLPAPAGCHPGAGCPAEHLPRCAPGRAGCGLHPGTAGGPQRPF
jgi:Cytosol aminopeptidase family, catalytic domain